jgi:hypothetical protein
MTKINPPHTTTLTYKLDYSSKHPRHVLNLNRFFPINSILACAGCCCTTPCGDICTVLYYRIYSLFYQETGRIYVEMRRIHPKVDDEPEEYKITNSTLWKLDKLPDTLIEM